MELIWLVTRLLWSIFLEFRPCSVARVQAGASHISCGAKHVTVHRLCSAVYTVLLQSTVKRSPCFDKLSIPGLIRSCAEHHCFRSFAPLLLCWLTVLSDCSNCCSQLEESGCLSESCLRYACLLWPRSLGVGKLFFHIAVAASSDDCFWLVHAPGLIILSTRCGCAPLYNGLNASNLPVHILLVGASQFCT